MSTKNSGPLLTSIYKGAAILREIPLRWRVKLGITQTVQENPTDVNPTALSGLLVASVVEQERTDERKKTDTSIGDPTGKSMVEYVRTKDGQVGTRTVTYVPAGTAPPGFDELTVEANQEDSGFGWSEQIIVTVPNLFAGNDYSRERRDVVPPEFAALLQTTEHSYDVAGVAADPSLGAGELLRREVQVSVQVKRITVRSRDISSLPKTIVGTETNRDKDVVTVTRIWEADTTTPVVPTALKDADFVKLGDGTAIQTTREIGAVFPVDSYTKTVLDLIPEKLRAIVPTTESVVESAGTPSTNPTLLTGELSRTESRVNEFVKRVRIVKLGVITLPVSITDKETNAEKQIVTVVHILNTVGSSSTVPTALIEVTIQNLGNGYEVETSRTVDSVFSRIRAEKSIPDLVPAEFQSAAPTTTTSVSSAGAITNPPVLSTGDLTKIEEQIDEFVKRVTTTSRSTISFPVTLTQHATTTEYGGGDISVIATINSSVLTIDTGLLVVSSETKALGAGLYLKITRQLNGAAWPVLTSSLYDEEHRIQYPETQQVIAAGTAIGTIADNTTNEIKKLDVWRSVRIVTSKTPIAVDVASALISYEMRPYTYPARLDIDLFRSAGMLVPLPQLNIGFQEPSATLARVKVRTWWETSATAPDVSEDNILPSVVVITHPSLSGLYKFVTCIHNAFTLPGTVAAYTYPASTPDFDTFVASWIGVEKIIGAIVEQAKEKNLWKVVTRSIVMR